MILRPASFLLVTAAMVVAVLSGYVSLVDTRVLASQEPPMNYPQFLLASSAGVSGKVIVESGSNSQHGIEPSILADYFQGPVIIVARNAGFPLVPKIYNLARYAEKGDVVILPLEWNLYVDDEILGSDFLKAISRPDSRMSYYYQNMPALEKIRFIIRQFPLSNVIESLLASENLQKAYRDKKAKLSHYRHLLDANDKTAFGGIRSGESGAVQKALACDGYILGNQLLRTGFTISDEFRRALASLHHLVDRGATVYFTWPAVVDSRIGACYQGKSLRPVIDDYADDIRSVVEEAGYQFVGDFREGRFPQECFADTPYHLTDVCAVDRTRRLVEQLVRAGVKPTNSATSPAQLLEAGREQLGLSYRALTPRLEGGLPGVERVRPNSFNSSILLASGWSRPEKWGVWSNGSESSLSLRVAAKLLAGSGLEIKLRGRYFNGVEPTGVTINGINFGQHVLKNKSFKVAHESLDGDILRLRLIHPNAISPLQLGRGKDARRLKYGLTEISVRADNE